MEKVLAIITEDAVYGRTLADYMTDSHLINYRVNVFFDLDDFTVYRDKQAVSVVLASESFEGRLDVRNLNYCIWMSSKKSERKDRIFMYQAMDMIVREVYFRIHGGSAEESPDSHYFKTYGVCGGRGGCGVSSLALCLARASGEKNSTLLISLDPFCVMPQEFEKSSGELSELIMNVKLYGADWFEKAENFIRHSRDFDYIYGVICYEDLAELEKEDMRALFAGLSSDGRYKTVVFDMGFLGPAATVVAEKCEKLFLIGEQERPETAMLTRQLSALLNAGSEGRERIVNLTLPYDEVFSAGLPEYARFDGSVMFNFAKELLEGEKQGMAPAEYKPEGEARFENGVSGYNASKGAPPSYALRQSTKSEIVVKEKEGEYVSVKSRLRRLMEKGFSEGFGG